CFFFFSSRRRHTRFSRDWSSDVCSSDLACILGGDLVPVIEEAGELRVGPDVTEESGGGLIRRPRSSRTPHGRGVGAAGRNETGQIGRASCRGSVERAEVAE